MRYFTQDGSRLIWRNNGETLIISPWGPDSMRVQSVLMGEIRDDRWALLDQQPTEAVLDIRDESASITVGKLTARITKEVKGVNRVLYDLTPKPSGTIEWE